MADASSRGFVVCSRGSTSQSLESVSSKESLRRHSRMRPPLPLNSICELLLRLHSVCWEGLAFDWSCSRAKLRTKPSTGGRNQAWYLWLKWCKTHVGWLCKILASMLHPASYRGKPPLLAAHALPERVRPNSSPPCCHFALQITARTPSTPHSHNTAHSPTAVLHTSRFGHRTPLRYKRQQCCTQTPRKHHA